MISSRDIRQRTSARVSHIAPGEQEQRARQTLLGGMQALIGQIGFEGVAREDVRDESIRDCPMCDCGQPS
jgi:hypothetical protein